MGRRGKKLLRVAILLGAALLALCVGWYVLGRMTFGRRAVRVRTMEGAGRPDGPSPGAKLRLGTYNIAHGRGLADGNWGGGDRAARLARLRKIARMLKEARLDVVVLNEVDFAAQWSHNVNQAAFIAREAGFAYWVEQCNFEMVFPFCSFRWGNAVLSRYPIQQTSLVDYPAHSKWEALLAGKKRGVVCTVELPEGRRIRLLAVHLEHRSEPVRYRSAEVIERLRAASDLPFVCAGDFNSTPVGYPRAGRGPGGKTALTLLLEGGGFRTLPDSGSGPAPEDLTFHAARPEVVIDWILVPPGWQITSKQVLPVDYSDHRPVIASVVMDEP